jgi:inner membrane protein
MDSLCHTLVGAALGEAGLKQRTRFGTAALMVSANIPDVDVFVMLTDMSRPAFRRGWTHGVLAQLLLPLVVTSLCVLFARWRYSGVAHDRPLQARWLLALSYIGVYSHVLLDLLNDYGVRLLAPFDWRWFYGDAVLFMDPWLWLALGLGVWLARRRRRPRFARGALILATCYIAVMVVEARTARTTVARIWQSAYGSEPRGLMVQPETVPFDRFTRVVVIDAGDHYRRGVLKWPRTLVLDEEPVPKNDHRAEVIAARETSRQVRDFLVWARFPFWLVESAPDGIRVSVADMRIPEAIGVRDATFVGRAVVGRSTQ